MLCNGSITACGEGVLFRTNLQNAVGVSSILTFRFGESNERSELDYFNSIKERIEVADDISQRALTFRFEEKEKK